MLCHCDLIEKKRLLMCGACETWLQTQNYLGRMTDGICIQAVQGMFKN